MRPKSSTSEACTPQPGDVIAGKYRVIRLIAEGGMGLVFEAHHMRLNHRVAIKILHTGANDVPDGAARFEREARAAVQLRGRNVARVYDVDALDDGTLFMVMEYLHGCDLATELDDRRLIPTAEAVGYILDACSAMSEAHRIGIVHRDLKPANLFISESPGGRVIKVVDFGISKIMKDDKASVTSTQSTLGTPHYMSPEQVRSAKHVDGRTDIWSLAVILYEMLAGTTPFTGDSASAIIAAIAADAPPPLSRARPDLPDALSAAVMKALSKDPSDRFAAVDDFADAIAPFGPRDAVPQSSRSWRGLGDIEPARVSTDPTLASTPALAEPADATLGQGKPSVASATAPDLPPRARTLPRHEHAESFASLPPSSASHAPEPGIAGGALRRAAWILPLMLLVGGAVAFFTHLRVTEPPAPSSDAPLISAADATGERVAPDLDGDPSARRDAPSAAAPVAPPPSGGQPPVGPLHRPVGPTTQPPAVQPPGSAPPVPPALGTAPRKFRTKF